MIEVYRHGEGGSGFRLQLHLTKDDNPQFLMSRRATWSATRPMTEVSCPWPLIRAAEQLRALLAAGAQVDQWDDVIAARLGIDRPKE